MGVEKHRRPIMEPGKGYFEKEYQTGARWIDGRTIFSKVVDTGALPNADIKLVPSGLPADAEIVGLRGVARMTANPRAALFLPAWYLGVGTNLEVSTLGEIRISANVDFSGFDESFVTVEYVKAS